ncbi:MAG: hypothetical protein JJU29_13900 [Verrucomicrobia bacterium]|nr:hypothetical protein [Verrucomicrobiota bacterium]MCH8514517.1 hypothetical protein [Kiritimatiellia bacterium]
MKPIHIQPVLLALFLLLPGLACPETNGFTEWTRLSNMVGSLIETEGRPDDSTLREAFENPEPIPGEIAEYLRDAAPVFDQLDLLADTTKWTPIDPETITHEYVIPFETKNIFYAVLLVNLKARTLFENEDADEAWALIHSLHNSLRYLDENGNLFTQIVSTAVRQLVFRHQHRLISALSDEALNQAIAQQRQSLEDWVSTEVRTRGEFYFLFNSIDYIFDQIVEAEKLQEHRDNFLKELRKTEKGRALAEQVVERELLSFEPWRLQVREARLRMREFELESFSQVPPRPIEEFYAFQESLIGDEQEEDAADSSVELIRILENMDPETIHLKDIQQLDETVGQSIAQMVLRTILPIHSGADLSFRKDIALQSKLMVYLAAEAYFRSNDKMPDSLEALLENEPRLAPDHIQDPFVPHPLRINRDDGHWRLYSVGENLEDHGGKEVPGQRKQDDWFLYFREGFYP